MCREYGLSVIENPQRGKSKHYGEWRAEQEGRPTYLSLIKADVDTAIRQSMTERQFFYRLRQMGYDIKVGKDITVRPPNYPRGRKLMRNFGEDYSMENIRKRILAQRRPRTTLILCVSCTAWGTTSTRSRRKPMCWALWMNAATMRKCGNSTSLSGTSPGR